MNVYVSWRLEIHLPMPRLAGVTDDLLCPLKLIVQKYMELLQQKIVSPDVC
jgi:hypothetical protein